MLRNRVFGTNKGEIKDKSVKYVCVFRDYML